MFDTMGAVILSWPKFERQLRIREYGEKRIVEEHASDNAEILPDGSNLDWRLAPKVHRVSSVELQKNVANRSRGLKDFDETVKSWTNSSNPRTHGDTHQVLALNISEEDHLAKEGDKYTGETINRSYRQRSYAGARYHSKKPYESWQANSSNDPSQRNSSYGNSSNNRWQRSKSTDPHNRSQKSWDWNSQGWNSNTDNAPWKKYVPETSATSAPASTRRTPAEMLESLRDNRDLSRKKRPRQFAEFFRRDMEWQSGADGNQQEDVPVANAPRTPPWQGALSPKPEEDEKSDSGESYVTADETESQQEGPPAKKAAISLARVGRALGRMLGAKVSADAAQAAGKMAQKINDLSETALDIDETTHTATIPSDSFYFSLHLFGILPGRHFWNLLGYLLHHHQECCDVSHAPYEVLGEPIHSLPHWFQA